MALESCAQAVGLRLRVGIVAYEDAAPEFEILDVDRGHVERHKVW